MLRRFILYAVPLILVSSASAESLRYRTGPEPGYEGLGFGYLSPNVSFENTNGSFEPGSTFSLGKFIIEAPKPGSSTNFGDERSLYNQFFIPLRTPDFDVPDHSYPYPVTKISGVVIQGHLTGAIGGGMPSTLTAHFDAVDYGFLQVIPLGHIQQFSFPVPLADVKLPDLQVLISPTDTWVDGKPFYSAEVMITVIPEPATLATWGLVGIGAFIARRRGRTRGQS